MMTKNDLLQLDKTFTPQILLWLYWVSIFVTFIAGCYSMIDEGFTFFSFVRGIFIFVFGVMVLRISMEFVLLFFKIEGHLRDIRDQESSKKIDCGPK
jgi:hypothetical protein